MRVISTSTQEADRLTGASRTDQGFGHQIGEPSLSLFLQSHARRAEEFEQGMDA